MAAITTHSYHPTVIQPMELASFIQYILEHHGTPTNLIVCASQEIFLAQLQASIAYEKDLERQEAEHVGLDASKVSRIASRSHSLLVPTIHQLATARTISVTFCATLAQLQAYVSVHSLKKQAETSSSDISSTSPPTLALINPLQLHHNTSSFSAQGLSRTFASAVEAAARTHQRLVIMECPSRLPRVGSSSPAPTHVGNGDEDVEQTRESRVLWDEGGDPWEQHVAILNVTTKSFGAGERGWVGRTVQVKRIVGRWCGFERLDA